MDQHIKFEKQSSAFQVITVENDFGSLRFTDYGAHILGYEKKGSEPVLWLSKYSPMEQGKAIRGGIPVCFPWFGNLDGHPSAPLHGVVRNKTWDISSIEATEKGSVIKLHFSHNQETLLLFPYAFDLVYTITLGRDLHVDLKITNTDNKPFSFEAALHSYFNTKALSTSFSSMKGVPYFDKADGFKPCIGSVDTKITSEKEVSNFYTKSHGVNRIYDNQKSRVIAVCQEGFAGITIWNPSRELGLRNPEIKEGWEDFVCLESTLCMEQRKTLEPSKSVNLSISIDIT